MTHFGIRLTELREQAGLSQADFARAVGVSRSAISRWESEGRVPRQEHLLAAAKTLGVLPGELLSGPSSPAPSVELLAHTFACIRSSLGDRFSSLSHIELAKLTAHIYERGGDLPAQEVSALLRLCR
jgi:transcriptional regulator with XRE-family HTH domain